MDKFAVVLEDDTSKTASSGPSKCRGCGSVLEKDGEFVLPCSKCGTAPREKRPNK